MPLFTAAFVCATGANLSAPRLVAISADDVEAIVHDLLLAHDHDFVAEITLFLFAIHV
jgi:hypothetical protein